MLYIEASKCWKIVESTKISIKMKNCKTFCEAQKRAVLMKLFSFSPTHTPSDKILLRLFFRRYTKINEHLLSKCFKNAVLGVKKRWSANVFFLTPKRNMFAGKFLVNSERFLAVLQQQIIFSVKWVEVHIMSEVFLTKLYCKMSELFQ